MRRGVAGPAGGSERFSVLVWSLDYFCFNFIAKSSLVICDSLVCAFPRRWRGAAAVSSDAFSFSALFFVSVYFGLAPFEGRSWQRLPILRVNLRMVALLLTLL